MPQGVFENYIQPGGQATQQRVGQAAKRGKLAWAQELVKNQDAAARLEQAGDLTQASGRIGYHGKDKVQNDRVEAGIGERHSLGVTLHGHEIGLRYPWQCSAQHCPVEVEADVVMLRRQMW